MAGSSLPVPMQGTPIVALNCRLKHSGQNRSRTVGHSNFAELVMTHECFLRHDLVINISLVTHETFVSCPISILIHPSLVYSACASVLLL